MFQVKIASEHGHAGGRVRPVVTKFTKPRMTPTGQVYRPMIHRPRRRHREFHRTSPLSGAVREPI